MGQGQQLPGGVRVAPVDGRHAPDERWVADITSIPTREGRLYLAGVEDRYSRMVVGWSMADHLESRLVVDALAMAVARRLPPEGLLAHSDRGSQYASAHYQRLLYSRRASSRTWRCPANSRSSRRRRWRRGSCG